MLEKIKKYKFIILFLFILLFFICIKNDTYAVVVNQSYTLSDGKTYSCNIDIGNNQTVYFIVCDVNSSNPGKVVSIYSYYGGSSFNYYYDSNGNMYIKKMNNDALLQTYLFYGKWTSTWRNYDIKIEKGQEVVYSSIPLLHVDTGDDYFYTLPKISIEYNENTNSYWCWTDWYDIRDIGTLSNFYAYGRHDTIDVNNPDLCWQWDIFSYEYKENEEGKQTIEREGFELWRYGIYSYCLWSLDTGKWKIYEIDFTEENLKGTEAEGCLDPFKNLNLYLDTSGNVPTVYSNFIQKDLLDGSWFSISFDNGESFSDIVLDCEETRIAEDTEYIRFYYKLYSNDTYTFRLRVYDKDHKTYEVIKTFTINSYESIIDVNGSDTITATPFISAYADTSIIRFSSQTFKERISFNSFGESIEALRYDSYYIDEEAYQIFGDNYEDWIIMDVGYEDYDKVTKGYPYFFKTEFSFENVEDGDKFYFVFYDKKLGCFSNVTTYVLENKTELLTISQNITFNNDRFNKLYNFFNEHFGFLNYPLEFIINLLNRIFNIRYEEPILHIPQLKVPTTGDMIFNGLDYNLNSVLEFPVVSTIYNIYLIAVDFVLVICFVIHTKNTLEGVLGSNG